MPNGDLWVNPTGNAGMATGGSGDVLTGIVAGLLAQDKAEQSSATRLSQAFQTTIAAVYLHGLAGDIAASEIGMRALIASDISAHLGAAFIEVGGDAEKP